MGLRAAQQQTNRSVDVTATKCPCCGSDAKTAPITVDVDDACVWLGWRARPVYMRRKQAHLVSLLVGTNGRIATTDFIIESLYDFGADEPEDARKTVQVYISQIRKILEPLGVKIAMVYGSGYRLTVNQPSAVAHAS